MRLRRRPATAITLARARELRGAPTAAEGQAWELLRNRRLFHLKFRRQHAIGRFIVDFYCAELKLVLELDGGIHGDAERAAYDAARATWLEAHGFRVIRLPNHQLSEEGLRRLLRPHLSSPSPLRGQGVRPLPDPDRHADLEHAQLDGSLDAPHRVGAVAVVLNAPRRDVRDAGV